MSGYQYRGGEHDTLVSDLEEANARIRRWREADPGSGIGGKAPRNIPAHCGTIRGYTRHRSRGEKPCEGCMDAYRVAARARAMQKRLAS